MKRGSLAYPLTLALLALPGALQATTPVSGNLRNLATLPPGGGAFVRFTLRGCQGTAPTVPNVAMLAGPGQPYFQDFVADTSGNVTGTLYSTRDAVGTGNGEIECPNNVFTASWYGMTIWFAGKSGPEMPVHARNGVALDPSNVTPLAGNPVVIAPTGDTVYARLDSGNQPFTGNVTAPRLISTVATGTAPLGVTSTTVVPNLNAALLNGATFAAPGAIGGTTPSTVTATAHISAAANPATVGLVRMANSDGIYGRNFGNSADVPLLYLDSTDLVNLGDATHSLSLAGANLWFNQSMTLKSQGPSSAGAGHSVTISGTNGNGAGSHVGGNVSITPGAGNNGGASGIISLGAGTTVALLPSAATFPGAVMYVTDSTAVAAEGQTCVGSSSNKALAFSNGSVWKCF